jgi:hypothetical protein
MGAQGTTTVDFGAFPGKSDTSVAVTGQAGIVSGSLVEAWLRPVATSDHTADEHLVEPIRIIAGNIVAATGFTIYAFYAPIEYTEDVLDGNYKFIQRLGGRLYGQWTVAWVWN